jgi:peptide-methionine (S)-S-oxide reductase
MTYERLLEMFWRSHDPTTLNRQGADVGTQYRSAIFWHNENQKEEADKAKKLAQKRWPNPIVTEVTEFESFYPAEDYHQDYYALHGEAPYCRAVIAPKMAKFRKEFGQKLNLD